MDSRRNKLKKAEIVDSTWEILQLVVDLSKFYMVKVALGYKLT